MWDSTSLKLSSSCCMFRPAKVCCTRCLLVKICFFKILLTFSLFSSFSVGKEEKTFKMQKAYLQTLVKSQTLVEHPYCMQIWPFCTVNVSFLFMVSTISYHFYFETWFIIYYFLSKWDEPTEPFTEFCWPSVCCTC